MRSFLFCLLILPLSSCVLFAHKDYIYSVDAETTQEKVKLYGQGIYYRLVTGVSKLYRDEIGNLILDLDLKQLMFQKDFSSGNCIVVEESYRTAEYGNAWAYVKCKN